LSDPTCLSLSVVIPIKDEEANLKALHERLSVVLGHLAKPYEILYIDDGSEDGSFAVLKAIHEADRRVTVVRLRKNFGQSAALQSGFNEAKGELIVTMDADLQNDPQDIPKVLEVLEHTGCDVVSGVRAKRKDRFLTRKLPSRIANWLISKATGVPVRDLGCSLKAYKREVIQEILVYGELHRFLPVLCALAGAKIQEVEVGHYPRHAGKSKYGLNRVLKVLVDLLVLLYIQSFATRPLHFFGVAGLVMILSGLAIDSGLAVYKIFWNVDIGNRPLLLLGILLILSGLQVFLLGIVAELFLRSQLLSSGKRPYAVRNILRAAQDTLG